jgi:hypothetical protein
VWKDNPVHKKLQQGSPDQDALTIATQEYDALRTEIFSRSSAQHTLLNLNITAIGVILGVVLTNRANLIVLLAVPVVATSFGLLYFDHAGAIERIGVYVRYVLRPNIVDRTGDPSNLAWDTFAAKAFRSKRLSVIAFAAPVFVIFIGSPAAASIAVIPAISQAWQWVLWALGLLAELVLCVSWYSFCSGRSFRDHQREAQRYQSDSAI